MTNRYAAFSKANQSVTSKISIQDLPINVPHLITQMQVTEPGEYGIGIKVELRTASKKKVFSYLPPRFVKNLDDEHIKGYQSDITNRQPPYLVFKGKVHGTFDIAILKFDLDTAQHAATGKAFSNVQLKAKEAVPDDDDQHEDDFDWLDKQIQSNPLAHSGDDTLNTEEDTAHMPSNNLKRSEEALKDNYRKTSLKTETSPSPSKKQKN